MATVLKDDFCERARRDANDGRAAIAPAVVFPLLSLSAAHFLYTVGVGPFSSVSRSQIIPSRE